MHSSGVEITESDLAWLGERVSAEDPPSRSQLARDFCDRKGLVDRLGRRREVAARVALSRIEGKRLVSLPRARAVIPRRSANSPTVLPPESYRSTAARVDEIEGIEIVPVCARQKIEHAQWVTLLDSSHYLGSGPLCGAQIRYLVRSSDGVLGALSFSAAAWRISARDRWIGWSEQARQRHLHLVISNSRFFVVPGIANLASYVLSRCLDRVAQDWQDRYGYRPLLVETFVDPKHFKGTSYRAAGWIGIGSTSGRGRQDRDHKAPRQPKDIYVHCLDPRAREKLAVEPVSIAENDEGDWARTEFGRCSLPDKRLEERLQTIARDFFARPGASIPRGCTDRAKTKATYRFFAHGGVSMQGILQSHYEATLSRAANESVVLAIQDTTSLNYSTHKAMEGLGSIGALASGAAKHAGGAKKKKKTKKSVSENASEGSSEDVPKSSSEDVPKSSSEGVPENDSNSTEGSASKKKEKSPVLGLLVHGTLAVNTKGTPLGLLDVQSWSRDLEKPENAKHRRELAVTEKESRKWLEGYEATARAQQRLTSTRLVSVADREADVFDLFLRARENADDPDLLVRAKHPRTVELPDHSKAKLWDSLRASPCVGTIPLVVPRSKTHAQRQTILEIRFMEVGIRPPHGSKHKTPLKFWAVLACENEDPPDDERVEWLLLTTLPVTTLEQACEKLHWYTLRWQIEVFHRTLKSGCCIEDRQLRTVDRIEACLAVDMIVAWRVFQLAKLGREIPDVPCTIYFDETQWKALVCFAKRTPTPPKTPPSLREAIRMVATLGGFLGRKSDGEPGTQTLWLGLLRLDDISVTYRIFRPGESEANPPDTS
jgi:hypothetical protein